MPTAYADTTTNCGASCPECGFVVVVEGVQHAATCPQCSTRLKLTLVVGRHNKAIPCDDRCQYARGPWCSCSCGGRNHRAGYIKLDMVPAWVRQRDADEHAKKAARAEAKKERARQTKVQQSAAQRAEHPELDTLMGADYDSRTGFIWEMRNLIHRGEPLTENQLYAVIGMVQRDADSWAQQRERADAEAAERAKLKAAGVTCPTGRTTFAGVIERITIADTHWGQNWRMLVKADAGWQVWTTVPREMLRQIPPMDEDRHDDRQPARRKAFRGHRVELVANITPALAEPIEGTAKRPTGRITDLPAVTEAVAA